MTSAVKPLFVILCVTLAAGADDSSYPRSGLATLYARDPVATSLCLADGQPGRVVQDNQVKNRCSDIDFGSYHDGSFSVGIEGARLGTIVDLGDMAAVQRRYGYAETVGGGQGFTSIRLEGGKLQILRDRSQGLYQDLRESDDVFAKPRPGAFAPIQAGHAYLVRITDSHNPAYQMLAKLLVIAYVPGESVTVRWFRL